MREVALGAPQQFIVVKEVSSLSSAVVAANRQHVPIE